MPICDKDIARIAHSVKGCKTIQIDDAKDVIWIVLENGKQIGPFNSTTIEELPINGRNKKNTFTQAIKPLAILDLETESCNRVYRTRAMKWELFLNNVPKFYVKKERELFQRYHKGDRKAFDEIISFIVPQVITYLDKYSTDISLREDFIQEGVIACVEAMDKFDPELGYRFLSYASIAFIQAIKVAKIHLTNQLSYPQRCYAEYKKICRIANNYKQDNQLPPTLEYIVEATNLPIENIIESIEFGLSMKTIELQMYEDTDSLYQPDNPDRYLMNESLSRDIDKMLRTLSQREAAIIRRLNGVGMPEMTADEIGDEFHLTSIRVNQLKDKAIRRLRDTGARDILKPYLGYANPYYPSLRERDYKPIGRSDDHDEFEQILKQMPEIYVDINQVYEAIQKQKETRRKEIGDR